MSTTKRKRYSAVQGQGSLEAIKGEQTVFVLGSRYGLYPNVITNWKRQVIVQG